MDLMAATLCKDFANVCAFYYFYDIIDEKMATSGNSINMYVSLSWNKTIKFLHFWGGEEMHFWMLFAALCVLHISNIHYVSPSVALRT